MSYYPVRLDDEMVGIGIVAVDITERQQADDFRSVVMQNIAEGLYVTDAAGEGGLHECRSVADDRLERGGAAR